MKEKCLYTPYKDKCDQEYDPAEPNLTSIMDVQKLEITLLSSTPRKPSDAIRQLMHSLDDVRFMLKNIP